MIQVEAVSKTFNPGTVNEVKALDKLTLSIPTGQFLVVIGSNGSGKSSLLNLLSGGLKPDSGQIFLDKTLVSGLEEYQRSRWISHIFQNPLAGTAPDLSILDNFRLASIRTHPKSLFIGIHDTFRKKVQEKISLLGMGLENKLDKLMGTLSGGQRQALTLIMAIMDDAKILLLDEPTAALDVKSARIVMETASRIIEEYSLSALLVTHNLRDVLQYGDRVIQMGEGRILKDILKSPGVELDIRDVYSWMDREIIPDNAG